MKTLISGKTVLLSTILSCVMAQIREVQQKIEIEWPKQAGGIYTIATITKKKQKTKQFNATNNSACPAQLFLRLRPHGNSRAAIHCFTTMWIFNTAAGVFHVV